MTRSRWILISSLVCAVLPACGGSDGAETAGPKNHAQAGSAGEGGEWGVGGDSGEAGSAGEPGSGGVAGEAGSAGQAGEAGSAGEAGGAGEAGSAGTGGTDADAGTGGDAGSSFGGSSGMGGSGGSFTSTGGTGGKGGSGGTSGSGGSGGSFTSSGGSGGTSGSGGSGGSFTSSGGTGGAGGSGGNVFEVATFIANVNAMKFVPVCGTISAYDDYVVGSFTTKYSNLLIPGYANADVTKALLVFKKGNSTKNFAFTVAPAASGSIGVGGSKTVEHQLQTSGPTQAQWELCFYCGGTMELQVEWAVTGGKTVKDTYGPVAVTCP